MDIPFAQMGYPSPIFQVTKLSKVCGAGGTERSFSGVHNRVDRSNTSNLQISRFNIFWHFLFASCWYRVLFSFTLFVEYSGTFRKFKIFYCLDLFSKSLHFSARWYISMRLLWYTTVSSCCQVQLWDRMAKLHCTSGGCAWVSQRSSSVWKYWSALLHLWGAFGTCFWWWTPTNRT